MIIIKKIKILYSEESKTIKYSPKPDDKLKNLRNEITKKIKFKYKFIEKVDEDDNCEIESEEEETTNLLEFLKEKNEIIIQPIIQIYLENKKV